MFFLKYNQNKNSRTSRYLKVFSVVVSIMTMVHIVEAKSGSTTNSVSTQVLQFFPEFIYGSNPGTHNERMGELLNTTNPPKNWPAFPRTWLELALDRTEITSTSWILSVTGFQGLVPVVGPMLRSSVSAQLSTEYKYNVNTTFIAISSLRPINPKAIENSTEKYGVIPTNQPAPNDLRRLVRFDETELRSYFNTNDDFPIVGLCKFEMSLKIAETNKGTLEFLVRQDSKENTEVFSQSFAVYSNFITIDSKIPTQEYLRTVCDEEFKHLVHYRADMEFNNIVKETFAHYHPQSECKLPDKKEPLMPDGDPSCMEWFKDWKNISGYYRRFTVPRCVLGKNGIPKCVARAKENYSCPLYYSNGKLTDYVPNGKYKVISNKQSAQFYCDKGYSCQPDDGKLSDYDNANFLRRWIGIKATCKKVRQ